MIREVSSLEENNLVAFYYLSASEIWLDKGVVIVRWEVPYKRGATILHINLNFFLKFKLTFSLTRMKKTVNAHADYIVQIFVAIKENRQDIFFPFSSFISCTWSFKT
jgi:hypothetical protein